MISFSVMSIQPWGWAQNPDLRGLCEIMRELGLDGIDWIGTHGLDPRDIRRMTELSGDLIDKEALTAELQRRSLLEHFRTMCGSADFV